MKCLIKIVFIITIYLLSSVYSAWPDSIQEPISRKSWRFTLDSTPPNSVLNNYDHYNSPDLMTIPQCIKGTAECIHAKNQLIKFASTLTEKSQYGNDKNKDNTNYKQTPKTSIEKLKNMYPTRQISKKKLQRESSTSDFKSKLFEIDISDDTESEYLSTLYGSGTNDTEGRIIAYKLNQTRVIPVQSAPTITLGQLARQMIFPEWLWTRLATTRRIGSIPTNTTRVSQTATTVAPARIPSITFDNNYSRFMKLFTMVRFQNTPCVGPSGQNGTCYHSQECSAMGGTASNTCASGFGVCCVFQNICGQTTSRNGTYFVDNGMVFIPSGVTTCTLQIQKITPAVKQMRLDFQIFSLQQPNAGNCELDRFIVSGQNTNDVIPILCGENNNTHLYVETEGSSTGIQLSVMTTGVGYRAWSIRITQFDTTSPSGAPTNCLQYHTGVMGTIRSFNYNSASSPQYLNNLNYAICIRKESGFCSVTFTNIGPDGTYMSFQVVNANDNGHLVIPSGQAGVGVRDCPFDFILINGYRLCGERLNDATTNILFVEDAPITDLSNGPFIVTVRTNELDVGGGFFLYYRQNPCMSTPG